MNIATLKVLAGAIYHHFRALDNPQADEMFIPVAAIRPDKKEPNTMYATIRYIVNYCGRKEHSVRIRFQVDERQRFINNSWSYVQNGKN